MEINPTRPAATGNLQPTKLGIQEQDPSVTQLPVETVTLGVDRGAKPKTKDYALADEVQPNADGSYVFDPAKDPLKFAPINVLANLQTGLDIFKSYCDQDKIPPVWFKMGSAQLNIYATDRKDEPNAFFNPMPFPDGGKIVWPGVHFGYFQDPKTKETVYAANSGEVVRHEGGAGHAFLNRLRPAYFRATGPDVGAFHESFGDVTPILEGLKNPKVVELVAQQTGGDLTKPNVVSSVGEQFGKAINNYVEAHGGPPNYTGGDYVRTAINDLKWQDPSTMPDKPDPQHPEQLSTEPHDYSRLWTGAVYECLGKMVKQNMAGGADAKQAITDANEDMLKIYGKLVSNTSPEGEFQFADMARAMIKADSLVGGKWGGVIKDVMQDRLILPKQTGLVAEEPLPPGSYLVQFNFNGTEDKLKDTRLAGLGNFSIETAQSGTPSRSMLEDDHADAKARVAGDLARLDRQGKILYTTPDQKPETISPFDPITKEPYTYMVGWENGQAKLERVPIFS